MSRLLVKGGKIYPAGPHKLTAKDKRDLEDLEDYLDLNLDGVPVGNNKTKENKDVDCPKD